MQPITLTKDFPFKSKNDVVEVFVRLRGYSVLPSKYNDFNLRRREKLLLKQWVDNRNFTYTKGFRPPEQRPRSQTLNREKKFSEKKILNNGNDEELKEIKRKKKIIPQYLYYTFTSTYKSNKIIISKTPLRGKFIMNNIKTGKDLDSIHKTKLKNNSSVFEYDSVFSEQDEISDLYKQIVESKVKKMFNGFNSCMFIMGPKKSGKTHTLIGYHKKKGILSYTMNTLLNYMNLSQEGMKCFYGIAASYVVTLTVQQFYLEFRDTLFEETIIFGIMNFNSIIEKINEMRYKLCDKYRIKDLIRKSHLAITFTLYQNNTGDLKFLEKNNDLNNLKELNDIQEISKFTFIEMNDANYAFNLPKAPTPKIYRETQNSYEDLSNISIQLSRKIQPEDPLTFFMQNLYDTVISCGTSIIILLCANPCDPHIETGGQILLWGYHLRNNLNYGIDYSSSFQIDNVNLTCKYIDSYLTYDNMELEIMGKRKKKKNLMNFATRLKEVKSKIKNSKDDEKENDDLYFTNNTNYQTLKDFEMTNKELEKIKKEQRKEREDYNIKFRTLEEKVKNLMEMKKNK